MIKKANIQWTAKQLVKMCENGTINFNSSVQRGYVWDTNRKSLLIHSMIAGYPVPAFYASKEDKCYSMLDGKQRSSAVREFINGDYKLSEIPEIELDDGNLIDVSGLSFAELPEDIQDEITGYSLTIYYFDGITDDEITELFYRLNNGKPLTAIELTRVKAKSIEAIKRIGQHELFNEALTDKAISKYTNEDIVIKSWSVLYSESKSLETKYIRPLMETIEITEEQENEISEILNRIQNAYNIIKHSDDKQDKKVSKRMLTRTHLISIIPITLFSVQSNLSDEKYIEWIRELFNGTRSATNIQLYNENASAGIAKSESVKIRLNCIEEHYNNFINGGNL